MPIGGGSDRVTVGTTVLTSGTTGSVLFVGAASVIQQDNANFFWDDTNNRFGLGNTATTGTGRRAAASGDYLIIGDAGAVNANIRVCVSYTSSGWASPAAVGSSSIGEKLVFQDLTSSAKAAIGIDGDSAIWFQSANAASAKRFKWYGVQAGTGAGSLLAMITADASGNASFNVANDNAVATSQFAYATGDYIRIGLGGVASSGTNKTTIVFNNNGFANPVDSATSGNGDKLVFWNASNVKTSIGMLANKGIYFQSCGASSEGFVFHGSNTAVTAQVASISTGGLLTTASTTLHATSVALTNGAGAATGTLTNAPAAGNPTKWIPISDNGVTRHIPAW